MTVPTPSSQIIAIGDGSTVTFSFPFIGVSASDITVLYTDADGAISTLSPSVYSLSLNAAGVGQLWGIGGTVTYPLSGSPIAIGTYLTISRTLPLTQNITVRNQGNYYAQVTEQALDIIEMQVQQVAARTGQFRGYWESGQSYNYGDIVQDGTNGANTLNFYMCTIANTSSVWATDLAAGDWVIAVNIQQITSLVGTYLPLAGGTITGNLVVDGSATFNGAVTMTPSIGMVFLSKQVASSSASIVFTSGIDGTYDSYLIVGRKIVPATDAVYMRLRYSTNSGVSYLTTSYSAQNAQFKGGSTNGTAPTDGINITPNTAAYFVSNAVNDGVNFEMYLHSPAEGVAYTDGNCTYLESASTVNVKGLFSGAYRGSRSAINALQFIMSSGNIASGTFYLYGLKKS